MNDREVLEGLLEGKVIMDESSWHDFQYKLIGDKMYVRMWGNEWMRLDRVLGLEEECVRIEGDE